MSDKQVDDRVVGLGFDNKDFNKGISDSSKALEQFDKSLANSNSSTGLGNLAGAALDVGSKFTALGTIATGALLSIGAQALELGQNLIRSVAIEPITQGYSEYELKINSIRTMLASGKDKEGLPVTLAMVNDELQKLNEYSDQTIYSFADMTANIGKFTNAGVSLPDAVQAIKGIANVAALSGANANEAARSMYNFAQALSAGSVKRIDWKSIELANMATVEFKQQLLDSAVAAGTAEKTADGFYKILSVNNEGKTMEQVISATSLFNESLEYSWMTTEVLTDTLGDYANAETDIGKRATDAATKVRTFSQLMGTVKESVGSGWSQTFELLIGNYDDATTLMTSLNNLISGMVQSSSKFRNDVITQAINLGAREDVIESFQLAWWALTDVLGIAKKAFESVFRGHTDVYSTAKMIADVFAFIYSQIYGFTEWLNQNEIESKILTIFKGIFSAISLAGESIKFVFDILIFAFQELFSYFPEGESILAFGAKIGKFFIDLKASSDKADFFAKATAKVKLSILSLISKLKVWVDYIRKNGGDKLFSIFQDINDKIRGIKLELPNFSFESLTNPLKKLSEFFESIKPGLISAGEYISAAFTKIKDAVGGVWRAQGFVTFSDVLNALLSGGLYLGIQRLIKSFTSIGDSASGFLESTKGVLDGVKGSLQAYQDQLKSKTLLQIAGSIALLAGSLILLSMIDPNKLTAASLAITVLFANLTTSFILLEKSTSSTKMSMLAVQLIGLSAAILMLVGTITILSLLDPEKLQQGLFGLAAISGGMVAFVAAMSRVKLSSFLATSIGMNIMAIAMLEMTGILYLLGQLDPAKLNQALTAMGVTLAEIAAFSIVLKTTTNKADLISAGATLAIMGYALNDIASVLDIIGGLNSGSLQQGLLGIAASLGIMVVAMKLMSAPNVLFGAAAMIVMAGAISIFTPAIVALGAIPTENVVQALVALAAIFVVVGLAGLILAPVIPAILGLAAAIALLGVAFMAVGAGMALAGLGMALFAAGLASLTTVGAAGTAAIIALVLALAATIPFILMKVGEGIIAMAGVVADGAPEITRAIGALISGFITVINEQMPSFILAVMNFIDGLLINLASRVPGFVHFGMLIITGFLTGISERMEEITNLSITIVTEFLTGLAKGMPEFLKAGGDLMVEFMRGMSEQQPRIVDEAFKMIISFINGLADAIRENTPLLLDAVDNLCTAFLDGVLNYFGITDGDSKEGNKIASNLINGIMLGMIPMYGPAAAALVALGQGMIDAFKLLFGINSPSTVMSGFGDNIVTGLKDGINSLVSSAVTVVTDLIDDMIQPFKDSLTEYYNLGADLADAVSRGIESMISDVVETVQGMADEALEGIKDFLEIASPSKKFLEVGKNMALGMANGVANTASYVVGETKNLGQSALSTMGMVMGQLSDAISTDVDLAPIITPVLDLSDVKTGANTLSSILDQNQTTYGLAQTVSKQTRMNIQNGSSEVAANEAVGSTISNNFNISGLTVRSETDINEIAKQLYQLQQNSMRSRGLRPAY